MFYLNHLESGHSLFVKYETAIFLSERTKDATGQVLPAAKVEGERFYLDCSCNIPVNGLNLLTFHLQSMQDIS